MACGWKCLGLEVSVQGRVVEHNEGGGDGKDPDGLGGVGQGIRVRVTELKYVVI